MTPSALRARPHHPSRVPGGIIPLETDEPKYLNPLIQGTVSAIPESNLTSGVESAPHGNPYPVLAPKPRLLDLFSGIGGFSLGLERAGFETVAFCEIEEFPRRVLAKHWPGVPIYDDVCTLTAERLRADGITVDAICGGFPCQDISFAGAGAGIEGKRSGLWREYARLIGELRPSVVVVENVSALTSRGLGVVLGDLALLGYDAEWDRIRAADVGAPHLRGRLWIVAYARGVEHEGFGDAFRRALAAGLSEAFEVNTGLCAGPDAEANTQHPDANSLGSHRAEVHELGSLELRHQQIGEPGPLGEYVADADGQPAQSLGEPRDAGGSARAGQGAGEERQRVRDATDDGSEDLADARGTGLPRRQREALRGAGRREEGGAIAERGAARPGYAAWWATEPNVGRVAHGVPARVDRLHGLGNAVVPEIPYRLGRAILAARQTLSEAA